MAKTLLFILGIYDTIDLFNEAFAASFRQLGCTCHMIDIRKEQEAMARLRELTADERLDGVITFNNIGYNLSFTEGQNIWEERNIPYFNILMDHPFHYANPLKHAPGTSVVFCTDRNHTPFLRRFYPHLKQVDFMPHAGMEADITEYALAGRCHLCTPSGTSCNGCPDISQGLDGKAYHPAMEERPIDVLYAGGLSKYVAEGLVPDLGEITEFDAFDLTQQVLPELIGHPDKTTEQAIEEYLLSIGRQYPDEELNHWITELRFIDSFATSFYREQAVRLLTENGIKVAVFGGGWDRCEWVDNPNLMYGGKVPAPQVLELMNHSRIVLNTMTWYKNGIHDRIINGMLAKSVVVTDRSVYLDETALKEQPECMIAFSLPQIQHLPELVQDLLNHQARMEQIAENGYRYAKSHHTWLQRADYIYRTYLKGKNE